MAAQTSPTLRRLRLARRLRELREQAGLTLAEAARRLDKTRSSLGRVEQGKTRADVHLVRTMMDIYDIRDDSLLDLAREAAKKGWSHAYGVRDRGYIDLETEASDVLDLQLLHIPGLLQTEAYMRVLFSSRKGRTPLQVDKDAAVRLHRQRRLTDFEAPLGLFAIVDESALHWPIGGAEVMRAQLRHLVEEAELSTVTLQVLQRGPRPHDGMNGAFTVLRFPEQEDPDVLFVEYPVGAIHIEDLKGVEQVKAAKLVFDQLRSEALSPRDSVALIERVAREQYG